MAGSLWGEAFDIKPTPKVAKKIINKVTTPKDPSAVTKSKSYKNLSIKEKLSIIRENVKKILGRFEDSTLVIRDRQSLTEYIDRAIANKEIAIDTETNNSLDPITCKLMGPCLYTPGLKQAYIPINHIDPDTKERLENQLTEQDVYEELSRLGPDVLQIYHNGKFDYQVLKCTCGLQMKIGWDTLVGAKILNENEKSAKLKDQYRDKIDSTVEKYSIDHLFEDIEYAVVEPGLFALYAATDSYMTYQLYRWQKEQYDIPDNARLLKLMLDIEMPISEVAAEMELAGVEIDREYAQRLSKKYHAQLDEIDAEAAAELKQYEQLISDWRLTREANYRPPKKATKKALEAVKEGKKYRYTQITENSFKWVDLETNTQLSNETADELGLLELSSSKSKNEQLETPINLASNTQLAIFLFDILKLPPANKNKPRAVGEEELSIINKTANMPLLNIILKRRGVLKLISTYVDKLPSVICEKDGRLHAHFNQLGAVTGRFSSSDPKICSINWGHKIRLTQGRAVA